LPLRFWKVIPEGKPRPIFAVGSIGGCPLPRVSGWCPHFHHGNPDNLRGKDTRIIFQAPSLPFSDPTPGKKALTFTSSYFPRSKRSRYFYRYLYIDKNISIYFYQYKDVKTLCQDFFNESPRSKLQGINRRKGIK
jgi:hypothetical protein